MEKRIIDTLLLNNFSIQAVLDELELDMIQLNSYINTDEFQTLLKSTIKIRKLFVELELFKKCLEKTDAASVKEFFRLLKEQEIFDSGTGNQFFAEFYREIEHEQGL